MATSGFAKKYAAWEQQRIATGISSGDKPMAKSERYQKGAAKMKELFGAEPQPGMMQEDFLNITVENLFGDIWNRPGLELRERSMITVAALTVLAREREL